ncbi:FtsX-like permease family protein [Nonomuraea ferruginea]|uniref:ABC transporter permease n=1 Tax=Nonomuraea ferruginea TaxID=46174 RepID=A0ABT4TCA7_9ACTN|nr:FtsX-like permease family protein [Nonomuraea ferruginea]MDA0646586.1 ABC transporter permease [Nonomuraea ferruginea]
MNLDLTWRLLKGGGRRGLLGTWLTLGAVAVATALLLFAVTANFAFQARGDRDAWRNPVAAGSGATAVEAARFDYVRDERMTVVDVAALPGKAPAPPPGLDRFPAPGEAWLSPALAELARELPADQLAARFPAVTGVLGEEALAYPGELVAVVGHRPDAPVMTAERSDDWIAGRPPTPVADFTGRVSEDAEAYQVLALIASVLMVVPLLVFGGAAARLTVARRDQRLAALRLVGATPGQVVGMTVAEAVIVAFAGAVAGTAAYAAAVPLLTRIEIGGGPWFAADLWPHPLVLAGALVAVPLLVGLSAVAGLRRVVVSPLGVARRQTPPGMRALRVLALLVVLAAFPLLGLEASVTVIAVAIALALLSLNLAGPWVVGLIGRVAAAFARTPALLLAGRRLVDDPRSAWRTVSGVALTGFVAGFLGMLSPGAFSSGASHAEFRLAVVEGRPAVVAEQAREQMRDAGLAARVEHSEKLVTVTVTGDAAPAAGDAAAGDAGKGDAVAGDGGGVGVVVVDRARTALAGLVPGRTPTSEADDQRFGFQLLDDVRVGTVVVLSVSFLVAIASAGITAASSVLDRRQTYGLLRLAGTPLTVLDRARRAETLIPLTVMGGGTIAAGVFCATPFMLGAPNLSGAVMLGICVALGFAGVLGAGALSRPLLVAVTTDPSPRPD